MASETSETGRLVKREHRENDQNGDEEALVGRAGAKPSYIQTLNVTCSAHFQKGEVVYCAFCGGLRNAKRRGWF